jgi:hypothetical protein
LMNSASDTGADGALWFGADSAMVHWRKQRGLGRGARRPIS